MQDKTIKINKSDLVDLLAESADTSKTAAERNLNNFIDVLTQQLKAGKEVNITGFGAFSVRKRQARTGINPKTGEKMDIKASKSVGFKVGKSLKEAVRRVK